MKAILVVDMPERCNECDYLGYNELDKQICVLEDRRPIRASDSIKGKPDWCPLKPVPGKKDLEKERYRSIEEGCYDAEDLRDVAYLQGKVKGYNACIDEILKGAEE